MSAPLRSEGWAVRPSFSPHGPTAPVTLLVDETGVTQLAGTDPVAWQVPWSELHDLRLVKSLTGVYLYARVAGRLFVWRTAKRGQFDVLWPTIAAHGGHRYSPPSRLRTYAAIVAVVLASSAGYLGYRVNHANDTPSAVTALRKVNLTVKDLSGSWTTKQSSVLTAVVSAANKLYTFDPSTTTTAPAATSVFGRTAGLFQTCLGVTNADDRIFGAAGQEPQYQVSSPVYSSDQFGGVQVESTTQYYASTRMVAKDTAEMSRTDFGACFAQANANLVEGVYVATPNVTGASSVTPVTFVHGWRRGGVVSVTIPSVNLTGAHLVSVVTTSGHFETTLLVLVQDWPQAAAFMSNLVNTLLARMTDGASAAA